MKANRIKVSIVAGGLVGVMILLLVLANMNTIKDALGIETPVDKLLDSGDYGRFITAQFKANEKKDETFSPPEEWEQQVKYGKTLSKMLLEIPKDKWLEVPAKRGESFKRYIKRDVMPLTDDDLIDELLVSTRTQSKMTIVAQIRSWILNDSGEHAGLFSSGPDLSELGVKNWKFDGDPEIKFVDFWHMRDAEVLASLDDIKKGYIVTDPHALIGRQVSAELIEAKVSKTWVEGIERRKGTSYFIENRKLDGFNVFLTFDFELIDGKGLKTSFKP